MVHRSKANQRSDYQFVADEIKRLAKGRAASKGKTKQDVAEVARALIRSKGSVSYFALHKLMYLTEYRSVQESGTRLTEAYFLRQKDGPYCVDLQITRLKRAIPELQVSNVGGSLELRLPSQLNLENARPSKKAEDLFRLVGEVVKDTQRLSDSELKTKVYMTKPMRRMLRQEQVMAVNLYNAPINFS